MSSSIHIQKANGGAITHNSRENYSKSVVFFDEKNELWNSKKEAYEIYRSELTKRIEAYTNRTNQKLQKTAVTQLSAVVNLEQHHTLKDLEKIKEELEKVFDTKVYQMAIHRDEGKLKHKVSGEYLASGIDFFLNPNDKKYYFEKRVENKEHIYEKELEINDYEIEKNYHAHIEMMGLDSQGQAIRQKMNRFVLSKLQDFTAETLQMERGKNYLIDKSSKRLDTHDFKKSKKLENEVAKKTKKIVTIEKNKIVAKANEVIDKSKEIIKKEKTKAKELENILKEKDKEIRNLMKEIGGFKRADFAEIEALKKELTNAKASEEQIKESYRSLQAKYESKNNEVIELTNELHLVKCTEVNLLEELEEIKLDVYSPSYKKKNEPVKNIEVVKHLEKEILKQKESLKQTESLKSDLEKLNKKLESDLNSLREQNRVLSYKVTTLEEKSLPAQNMSDYEQIKKENADLKKENSDLKSKIQNILDRANAKIKSLLKFKIFQDVKFGSQKLHEDEWQMEVMNDVRLENKYNAEITGVLVAADEKIDLKVFEKLNRNLAEFTKETEKEKEEDYSNDWGMQR